MAVNKTITFNGKGGPLFLLYLKNIFLTVITLGVYSFWARVNITRYMYQSTVYQDRAFEFHGTGREKFVGFLKALLLLAGLGLVGYGLYRVLSLVAGPSGAFVIIVVLLYLSILAVIPLIMIGSARYRMSRSSYRNIRFGFSGRPRALVILWIRGIFLTAITLGIYYPWFLHDLNQFMVAGVRFGSEPFSFDGSERGKFAKKVIIGFFLTIITFGLYSFWLTAAIERFVWGHTSIQGKRFSSNLGGGDLFGTTMLAMFLVVFTLGFGAPWAAVFVMRLMVESVTLEDGLDFSAIKADFDSTASALADGLSDASDIFETIADFLG